MSQPRGFGLNGKSYYSNIAMPMDVNLQFTVTPTNGLGVTSVKSNGYVRNVFMHTSTTPAANNGYTNPNPAAGYAWIQMNNNFNAYLGGFSGFVSPTITSTKIDNSALTIGNPYVITTVGDASLAVWQAIGLPPGVTPAVGQSFIALTVGAGANSSTSRVQVPSSSGASAVEIVGNPNAMISNSNISSNGGAWIMAQFLGEVLTVASYTPAGTINTPTFTGDALANHSHSLFFKNAAVADGASARVNAGSNLLGANTGSDITVAGGAATNGGIVNASAGTPAGTISALTFTGSAGSLTGTVALGAAAPATGSVVNMFFRFDGSSVSIDGL